ncbi:uncharacterized protein LOC109605271 [Aethina tumida]|uniref:uncharacterized protein LOC109605271 n=1 Tax=Aethina tumida TaxID=116153 RepID=UPI00096B54D3|nr:uncharacterized protein LOC109605271 [Aethina tumida]
MWSRVAICAVLVVFSQFDLLNGEESSNFFLKASKSVPRIGRNKGTNADFEKFFLKASKSVPRIGRRNQIPFGNDQDDVEITDKMFKYPTWSEITDKYEYEPDMFNPSDMEKEFGDPSVFDWEKVRMKRRTPSGLANLS